MKGKLVLAVLALVVLASGCQTYKTCATYSKNTLPAAPAQQEAPVKRV